MTPTPPGFNATLSFIEDEVLTLGGRLNGPWQAVITNRFVGGTQQAPIRSRR